MNGAEGGDCLQPRPPPPACLHSCFRKLPPIRRIFKFRVKGVCADSPLLLEASEGTVLERGLVCHAQAIRNPGVTPTAWQSSLSAKHPISQSGKRRHREDRGRWSLVTQSNTAGKRQVLIQPHTVGATAIPITQSRTDILAPDRLTSVYPLCASRVLTASQNKSTVPSLDRGGN